MLPLFVSHLNVLVPFGLALLALLIGTKWLVAFLFLSGQKVLYLRGPHRRDIYIRHAVSLFF